VKPPGADVEDALFEQSQRRLRLFLLGDTIAFVLGALTCLALYLVWVHSVFFLIMSLYTFACGGIVAAAYRGPAARGEQERAVTWMCAAVLFASVGGALFTPAIAPVMTLSAQMPAVLALPYVSRRRLRILLPATVASLLAIAVLARVQDVTGIDKRIPTGVANWIVVGVVTGAAGLMLLVAWQSYDTLVHTNAALRATTATLAERAEELAQSRARLVAATDEARRRIERDLHDGAQQQLTTLAVKLDLAHHALSDHPETDRVIGRIRADLRGAIAQVRSLAHGIYPPLLAGGGLAEALPEAVAHASVPTHADIGRLPRYHPDVESAVYFCCLEALTNAAKHAGPGATASVHARGDGDSLTVTIADTGAGFELVDSVVGGGLSNMVDRVAVVGGSVRVESSAGAGTRVTIEIPRPAPRPA
jgi:signal transduction histidine kinase